MITPCARIGPRIFDLTGLPCVWIYPPGCPAKSQSFPLLSPSQNRSPFKRPYTLSVRWRLKRRPYLTTRSIEPPSNPKTQNTKNFRIPDKRLMQYRPTHHPGDPQAPNTSYSPVRLPPRPLCMTIQLYALRICMSPIHTHPVTRYMRDEPYFSLIQTIHAIPPE